MKKEIVNIKPSHKKGEKRASIELGPSLTIDHANQIKTTFVEASEKYDTIELIGKNIQMFDLTFVQLVEALKKHMAEQNKTMLLKLKGEEDMITLAKKTGMEQVLNLQQQ